MNFQISLPCNWVSRRMKAKPMNRKVVYSSLSTAIYYVWEESDDGIIKSDTITADIREKYAAL